jgi:hypothetical protein
VRSCKLTPNILAQKVIKKIVEKNRFMQKHGVKQNIRGSFKRQYFAVLFKAILTRFALALV